MNYSSVAIEDYPNENEVIHFLKENHTALNKYPQKQVLSWLKNDKDYIANENYVHFKDIEFQPIYVNLNGQKIPSNIVKVACLNPQISKRTIER